MFLVIHLALLRVDSPLVASDFVATINGVPFRGRGLLAGANQLDATQGQMYWPSSEGMEAEVAAAVGKETRNRWLVVFEVPNTVQSGTLKWSSGASVTWRLADADREQAKGDGKLQSAPVEQGNREHHMWHTWMECHRQVPHRGGIPRRERCEGAVEKEGRQDRQHRH